METDSEFSAWWFFIFLLLVPVPPTILISAQIMVLDLNHIFLTHDRFHCHVTKQYGAPPHQYLYLEQIIIDYSESEWHGE